MKQKKIKKGAVDNIESEEMERKLRKSILMAKDKGIG